MLLLNRITGEMYLTRNRKKVLFIDELKQQLGDIGADDPIKAAVVEEAARRARKYGGSLVTATQQADDYYASRQMEAAFQCSDWLFHPPQQEGVDRTIAPSRQDRQGRGQETSAQLLAPGAGRHSPKCTSTRRSAKALRACRSIPTTRLLFFQPARRQQTDRRTSRVRHVDRRGDRRRAQERGTHD